LPTYPFERQRYWIESQKPGDEVNTQPGAVRKKPDTTDWFYLPSWKRATLPERFAQGDLAEQKSCWLVFIDASGLGSDMVERLEQAHQDVISVAAGEQFNKVNDHAYTINPRHVMTMTHYSRNSSPYRSFLTWSCTYGMSPPPVVCNRA
jgi:acyl transferase domain-containing protein